MDSELSASSDEAGGTTVACAGTSKESEASSDQDTPNEPDAPSSFVAYPEVILVSVRSSSDWEAVTTPDSTFLGVALEHVQHGKGWKCLGARTRVTLIIRANDHARRRGDSLRSPGCIDSILLGCHSR